MIELQAITNRKCLKVSSDCFFISFYLLILFKMLLLYIEKWKKKRMVCVL